MTEKKDILRQYFSFKRIIIPVLIGIGITLYMSFKDINKPIFVFVEPGTGEYVWSDLNSDGKVTEDELFLPKENEQANIVWQTQSDVWLYISENWAPKATLFLLMALLMVVIRDFAYMYRIRILTDKQLSWKKSFQVIMLWEFSSALTPSVVGGSAIALVILTQEGIRTGRSTAIVMITALLDELFYIIMVPVILLLAGVSNVFSGLSFVSSGNTTSVQFLFALGYGVIVLLTCIILFAIIFKPYAFKRLLVGICHIRFLRRWKKAAVKTGDDIITTSKEMRSKNFGFWFKTFGATMGSWTARFLVVNFLLLTFIPGGIDHLLVFAKQLVMWVIMLISPTPGSSGVAEFMFPIFFKDFITPGTAPLLVILWRLMTYYPYIIIGAIVLPFWLKRVLKRRSSKAL
ncbi:flippase-like domain-containing protein [Bacteroidales bacterium OttesenSCG-928-C19]|nr:flippase-like domain-containing protein [Bacteroidales bacterium OttesenSCG-928-C19]